MNVLRSLSASLLASCAAASPCALAADPPFVAGGYFASWAGYEKNYQASNVPAAFVSHLFYAFAKPVFESPSSASLALGDSYADVERAYPGDPPGDNVLRGHFNQLLLLKRSNPHLKTLVSAGGWSWSDAFSPIASNPAARAAFVESCVAFATNYSFDGIDVDWEYPAPGTGDPLNFALLLAELRQRLDRQSADDGRPYLLTAAVSADYASLTNRYPLADIAPHLDWFNVMSYDFAGPWLAQTAHDAPLLPNPSAPDPGHNVLRTVQTLLSNGVPASKIVVGIPYCGKSFSNVPPSQNGLFQSFSGLGPGSWQPGILDFADLSESSRGHGFLSDPSFSLHRDPAAAAPWLYSPSNRIFVTFDDEASVARKARLVRDMGLRGTMCWSLDMDSSSSALQRSAFRELYPLSLSFAPSNSAATLRWFAWTGSTYSVETSTSVSANAWSPHPHLVDSLGQPSSGLVGQNAYATLVETQPAPPGVLSAYRWKRLPPPP